MACSIVLIVSGWGPGQPEGEIDAGGCVSSPAARDQVFRADDQLWPSTLKLAGRRARLSWINAGLIPDDPSVN